MSYTNWAHVGLVAEGEGIVPTIFQSDNGKYTAVICHDNDAGKNGQWYAKDPSRNYPAICQTSCPSEIYNCATDAHPNACSCLANCVNCYFSYNFGAGSAVSCESYSTSGRRLEEEEEDATNRTSFEEFPALVQDEPPSGARKRRSGVRGATGRWRCRCCHTTTRVSRAQELPLAVVLEDVVAAHLPTGLAPLSRQWTRRRSCVCCNCFVLVE